MREIREYQSDLDLNAVRKVAGNSELTAEQVFNFGTFVIARSGKNHNATEITAEGQRAAVDAWIGKAILLRDHEMQTENQIGRIYAAWIEEDGNAVVTKGKGFGVRTDDHADIFARIENGIHREMSCGYDPIKSLCSSCGSELDSKSFSACPNGHKVGVDGVIARDVEFSPDHISFVARPAVEGAGLVAASRTEILRQYGIQDESDETIQTLIEDGRTMHEWAANEFRKYYIRNNPGADAETITKRLSARDLMNLARVEKDRLSEALGDGSQQVAATKADPAPADVSTLEYQSIEDLYKARRGGN